MTKFFLNLIFIFVVALCSADVILCQTTEKSFLLNPPKWILGEWRNLQESDTRKFQSVFFEAHEVTLFQGFGNDCITTEFSQRFKDFKIIESVEPTRYQIEFDNNRYKYIYKFELNENLYQTNPKTVGLYFSVSENGKVVKEYGRTKAGALLLKP